MSDVPERIYIRRCCCVPIRYKASRLDGTDYGIIQNCSVDGMYMEVKSAINPGTEIEVKVKKKQSCAYKICDYNNYRLRVVWCEKKSAPGQYAFGVGAKRIFPNDKSDVPPDKDWNTTLLSPDI